jgi:5'-nucleotidase
MRACHRRVLATVALAAIALSLQATHASASGKPDKPQRALDILITNDDGWIGPGGASTPLVVALRDALVAEGHRVTVVAPATDQSGNGTRLTFAAPLTLANPQAGVWTVTGSPGDSVVLGLDVLFAADPPDLVVSGINPGGNYSSILNHSGTVGAATTALELGVPAIAVSVDGNAAQSVALKDTVARYTGELIETLARSRRGPLLPDGLGLNVNYPGGQPVKGATLTRQDPHAYFDLGYANTTGPAGQPGVYRLAVGAPTATPARGSDWDALGRGYVSITPIDADRTAGVGAFGSLGGLGRW